MNFQSCFIRAGSASLLAVILAGANLQAAPSSANPGTSENEIGDLAAFNRKPVTDTFQMACLVLGPGKHNYLKHRGNAMDEIREASKLLGVEIAADKIKKADENQTRSDARLQLARLMLEQVRTRLTAEDQKPALEHVDKALSELTKGLEIRAVEDEKDPADQGL